MKFIGYESYTSWIVTFSACIINFLSYTPYRIVGLLYVSIADYYETNRETAALPVLIYIIIRCTTGPICGILGEKLGAECVTFYGSILACIGFGACFFAESITGLIICLGLVFGIGMVGSSALLPSILKKYFFKNINTANGIGQAGSAIGAILFPPVAVYFLNEYGLPGTFLIISAIMLHAVPVSMVIRNASLVQDKIIAATKRKNQISSVDTQENEISEKITMSKLPSLVTRNKFIEPEKNIANAGSNPNCVNACRKDLEEMIVMNICPSRAPNDVEEMDNKVDSILLKNNQLNTNEKNSKFLNADDIEVLKLPHYQSDLNANGTSSFVSAISSDLATDSQQANVENKTLTAHVDIQLECPTSNLSLPIEEHKSISVKKSKLHHLKIFLNRPFLVIMFITGLHNYISVVIWTTVIDYSRDKGISRTDEVYFLMIHPICELIGRISFGWVIDLGFLTLSQFSMIDFTIMGLTCGCILWSVDFWTMLISSVVFAVSGAGMTAVFPGMVFACVPEELHNMAIASRYTLSGPLILTSAPLIGVFRENLGSYDGFYYLLICCCAICIAVLPLIDKYSSRAKGTKS